MPLERLIYVRLDFRNFWLSSLSEYLTSIRLQLVLSIVYLKPNKEKRGGSVFILFNSILFHTTDLGNNFTQDLPKISLE